MRYAWDNRSKSGVGGTVAVAVGVFGIVGVEEGIGFIVGEGVATKVSTFMQPLIVGSTRVRVNTTISNDFQYRFNRFIPSPFHPFDVFSTNPSDCVHCRLNLLNIQNSFCSDHSEKRRLLKPKDDR